jgi:GDPmannose 4,6-dehydratase
MVAKELDMKIKWKGKGIKEKAFDEKNRCVIECKTKYLRPAEVDTLKGNFSKAKKILKWKPKNTIKSLIKDMINYELNFILR